MSEFIEVLGDEDENGKGYYAEVAHFDDDLEKPLNHFEYQREGFNAATGEPGTITITEIVLPARECDLDLSAAVDIVIPDKIDSLPEWNDDGFVTAPVTAIGAYATDVESPSENAIRSAELPKTLKSVGRAAFTVRCSDMKGIEIPESVDEIGEYAFGYIRDWQNRDAESYKKIDGFVISCYPGTAGEKYAKDNGFEIRLITDN